MTKDGPDFPDRLLVAGRFDGYLFPAKFKANPLLA
jgi:hypothetical protein